MDKNRKIRSLSDLGAAFGIQARNMDSLGNTTRMTSKTLNTTCTPNMGWLFYKDYFRNVRFDYVLDDDQKQIKAENARIIKEKNRKLIEKTKLVVINDGLGIPDQKIEVQVCYPGLITGTGITHEAGIEGEFKLGLHFDYTYGMPVIHGSSVKGLLRSVFPKGIKDKYAKAKLDYLIKLLNDKFSLVADQKMIKQIEDEIFEGKKSNGTRIDIYHRDIFFDAIVVKPDYQGRIVESDAITPHNKNPLKNPVPIPFLKISPGCTIQFRFDLKKGEVLDIHQKWEFFQEILKTLGIGAKTNVGYGQFEP
ncbi:MAG: type III-B CRISPR module RAMP protein Cmr6 [Prolixibacteraceae bacterium]|jgi:CRISPR-associated protein Cmr6|nr:type III-B CRISPR module RAMP protein Cmr6 [Prolixibacteraceae bacterium]